MESGYKTKLTIATLLAGLSHWSPSVMADERFIFQPKHQQSTRDLPAIQPGDMATKTKLDRAPQLESVDSQLGPLISVLESQQPSQVDDLRSPPDVPSQSSGGKVLRWVARGGLSPRPDPTDSDQPPVDPSQAAKRVATAKPPLVQRAGELTINTLEPMEFANPPSLQSGLLELELDAEAAGDRAAKLQSPGPLASMISNEIISSGPTVSDSQPPVEPIDAPPGWHAVGRELSQHMANCETLINKRAFLSAREEAEAAMLYLVRVIDLAAQQYTSEPDWISARRALLEAEDFANAQRLTTDSDLLRRIILSHETPVLKQADVTSLAPLAAAQHYRLYAEQKLVESAQGHPWASEVLYTLGRAYQAQADATQDSSKNALRWRAVSCYRSACSISPRNHLASNQLGYVMLQMDRPADARASLLTSIQSRPTLAAFENLVEAARRLGDTSTGHWALENYLAMKRASPATTNAPRVIEVAPQTFAAISPYGIGPHPQPSVHMQTQATVQLGALPANANAGRY